MKAIIFDFFGVVRVASPGGAAIDQALLEFIAELKQTYKTALLSNTGASRINDFLPLEQQQRYFDVVATSQESGYLKPSPEAYLAAAARLGVRPEECIMIDDAPMHCEGARHVGMQAILYTDLAACKVALRQLLANNTI